MEITLDLTFIQSVLAQERKKTLAGIRELGVLSALEASQQRHDARLAAACDAGTLACRAGCMWCCYFSVDVRAVEVFRIMDFVERSFTDAAKARVFAEIRSNSAALRKLDEGERATRNIKCPFLHERQCTIYAVRPQSCRNYHATDVAGCRQSYEDPQNVEIDPEFAPYVYQGGAAHVEAFSTALRDSGFDVRVYEFSCAMDAAMSQADARKRFEAGLQPFVGLEGDVVALEFDDLDTAD